MDTHKLAKELIEQMNSKMKGNLYQFIFLTIPTK